MLSSTGGADNLSTTKGTKVHEGNQTTISDHLKQIAERP
jgi:hypothetical protein